MALTSQVHLGPRVVTVRELTFADVRDWLRRREILKSCDVIHALAFEDFGIDDLAEMSDATTEEMEACAPSELAADRSLQGAEPAFFRTRAALAQAAAPRWPMPRSRPRPVRVYPCDARACGVWGYTWSAYLAAVALANESTQSAKAR